MPIARFLAELAGMCAVMCIGGSVLSLASFAIAKALGYSNLAQQALELSAAFVTVCVALPMAVSVAVRGHGRRRNVVMTGSTVGVGIGPDRPAVVRRHLCQWTADMAKPVRADLPPARLVMVVETLLEWRQVVWPH
jgi:hypothetical protein